MLDMIACLATYFVFAVGFFFTKLQMIMMELRHAVVCTGCIQTIAECHQMEERTANPSPQPQSS
jgi:hypothetical protein